MHAITLAAGPDWSVGLLAVIAGIMKFVAVLVVLFAAVKGTKDAMGGKVGKAVALVAGCLALVVFLWEPSLINKLIDMFTGVTSTGIDSGTQIINDSTVAVDPTGGK